MREKEPSRATYSSDHRFTLPKSQILSGRRNFEELFNGSSFISKPAVNIRYSVTRGNGNQYYVGFIAPKKIGNAVERNRAKRFMREAYRLNQHIITELPQLADIKLKFAFLARRADLTFETVQKDVVSGMEKLRERILSNHSTF
ncbi:ribonuclease P protein component [Gracilimonas sp. Q87]|uniref:ribonuclease P protein component n=1 Tax=Gracilimonas sp. Q87 TaxID=3384766 RepID=UPI0039845E48